ncbi:ankyrin repeat-containing domain protein [Lasiosphaeria ovina]|uniref:Ankyrin repeat-containing domain protein n=1 Tax=Lasiosphaeria ovina TaxID=92902 RepID=A0AAE0MYN9_9PEZI|nr:ankyrin repeat-containing domain protein [Lasiosphaeria ovina]
MDPLSLAASIIAVVQVSQSIVLACYRIRHAIKDADDDIARLIADVESLEATLEELRDIVPSSNNNPSALESLSIEDGGNNQKRPASAACLVALRSCETTLKELDQKLQPLAKPGLKTKLRWPFESSLIERKLTEIGKLKATLQLALAAYHARLLGQQSQKLDGLTSHTKRAAILSWFKTSDPEQNHKLSRSRHEQNTSRWIFDVKEFADWKQNPGKSLWLHGIPGAGKTILCSTVVDNIIQEVASQKSNTRVIYFYFDFSDAKKQSVADLIKSLIYQLISAHSDIPEAAEALFTKCNGLTEPGLDELFGLLMAEISRTERTFVFVDALDECPKEERPAFLETFFQNSLPDNLSLWITSRREPDIEAVLKPSATHTVCIQNSSIDADVRIHVNNSIARDPRLSKWKPAVQNDIANAIVGGSHGMFRWAVCQLDTMKKCLTPAMVHAELKRMPETLDQTYDRILQTVPTLHSPFVQSALHWLAFSGRPLQLRELAEAAVVNPKEEAFDPDLSRLFDENMILELCGSLVTQSTIEFVPTFTNDWLAEKLSVELGHRVATLPSYVDRNFVVVSLAHFSVKEYILSPRLGRGALAAYLTSERLANSFIAKTCLLYLLSYNSGEVAAKLDFDSWPLLEYAARQWIPHWRNAAIGAENMELSDLRGLAEKLLDPINGEAYVNWLNVSIPDTGVERNLYGTAFHREMRRSVHNLPQQLYWAAYLGDVELVQWLIEQGADVCAVEGNLGSAIGAAAYHGHSDVVECLLLHGADPNLANTEFGNVLQIAALGGSVKVIKQLLDAGALVNAQGGTYNTALIAAASKENYDIVALLIKRGADLNLGSRQHGSSLYQAALAGDTKMVVTLLAAGADINALGTSEGTALYAAAISGSVPLVQLLLRKGAKVNKFGPVGEFGYPISAAANKGHSQIVRVLIRAGADVNVWGGHRGVTCLEAAVESRDMATFRVVLDAGADPSLRADLYENCFHAAIWTGEHDMAKVLLDRNAEFGDLAFLTAVELHDDKPVFLERLLERSPNLNAWDKNIGSALHVADGSVLFEAIEQRMTQVAKELLLRGADPNRKTKHETPFTASIYRALRGGGGNLELAELLLQKGADVNGGNGLAVYWAATSEGDKNESVLRFLVKHGANLNLVAARERCTALQGAAKEGRKDMIDLLIELGADMNGPAGDDGFVIHYAIQSADKSMVRHVLQKGALIDDSRPYCSSLQRAISGHKNDLIPLLLDSGADIIAVSPARAMNRWGKNREAYTVLIERGAVFDTNRDASYLVEQIEASSIDDFKQMVADGMDVNCHTSYQSPILQASVQGLKDTIQFLLDAGADINYAPDNVASALVGACRKSDIRIAEFLLEHGADPNLVVQKDVTALSAAVRTTGNLQLVELLLSYGAEIGLGEGHVFQEAVWGGEKILARLLEEPMTDSQRERFLDAALQAAAHWAVRDIVGWLLDQGANPAYSGGCHGCPLTAALCSSHIYDAAGINNRRLITELLLQRGAEVNPPAVANAEPNFDSNLKAPTHPPPLIACLGVRSLTQATFLLKAGADPNLQGGELYTAVQAAARYCSDMVVPLLSAGADPLAITAGPYGTALHAAAYAHKVAAIEALLAAGADPNVVAGKYGTPLQAAAKLETVRSGWSAGPGSLHALKTLAAAGADVHALGGKYGSALQMAAKSGNLGAVRWLVEDMGVDLNVLGGRFGSVREAAVRKGHWGVVVYLERAGGKINWEGTFNQDGKKWKGFKTIHLTLIQRLKGKKGRGLKIVIVNYANSLEYVDTVVDLNL